MTITRALNSQIQFAVKTLPASQPTCILLNSKNLLNATTRKKHEHTIAGNHYIPLHVIGTIDVNIFRKNVRQQQQQHQMSFESKIKYELLLHFTLSRISTKCGWKEKSDTHTLRHSRISGVCKVMCMLALVQIEMHLVYVRHINILRDAVCDRANNRIDTVRLYRSQKCAFKHQVSTCAQFWTLFPSSSLRVPSCVHTGTTFMIQIIINCHDYLNISRHL